MQGGGVGLGLAAALFIAESRRDAEGEIRLSGGVRLRGDAPDKQGLGVDKAHAVEGLVQLRHAPEGPFHLEAGGGLQRGFRCLARQTGVLVIRMPRPGRLPAQGHQEGLTGAVAAHARGGLHTHLRSGLGCPAHRGKGAQAETRYLGTDHARQACQHHHCLDQEVHAFHCTTAPPAYASSIPPPIFAENPPRCIFPQKRVPLREERHPGAISMREGEIRRGLWGWSARGPGRRRRRRRGSRRPRRSA